MLPIPKVIQDRAQVGMTSAATIIILLGIVRSTDLAQYGRISTGATMFMVWKILVEDCLQLDITLVAE